jgi:hypothetical protein
MALPKVPPDSGPTIGMYPDESGVFDPRSEVLPTLKKKASRYGHLDRPYVIAVLWENAGRSRRRSRAQPMKGGSEVMSTPETDKNSRIDALQKA